MEAVGQIFGSETFFFGLCGGFVLGLVHCFQTVREANRLKIETMGTVYGGLSASVLVFAIVGGLVASVLGRDEGTGAFFSGLTSLGLVALFLGSITSPATSENTTVPSGEKKG